MHCMTYSIYIVMKDDNCSSTELASKDSCLPQSFLPQAVQNMQIYFIVLMSFLNKKNPINTTPHKQENFKNMEFSTHILNIDYIM